MKKEAEKILKYKDLAIVIQFTRNVKSQLTPVTIWANVKYLFRKYLSNIR